MVELPPEYLEIQQRIEREKLELEQVRLELEELGASMKKDYMREVLKPVSGKKFSDEEAAEWNTMCKKCFKSCKQPESVKIYHCHKFEPLKREDYDFPIENMSYTSRTYHNSRASLRLKHARQILQSHQQQPLVHLSNT